AEDVVNPFADPVVLGALQPLGTSSVTVPSSNPPDAAVYVKVMVLAADPASTLVVGVLTKPLPSGAFAVIWGESPRVVRARPETVIVWPDTDTVPAEDVVNPFAEPVALGALQPGGTASVTAPFTVPPEAAVYVNVMVLPAEFAETFVVGVVRVPLPSAEET